MNRVANYWENTQLGVKCLLCPNYCSIPENKKGKCRKRINLDDELFTENYAQTISLSLDPLEKKPLYHFFPTEKVLSLGANSCNLTCQFCQNYSSSQSECDVLAILPVELYDMCLQKDIKHVAFTYTEPFTWYEYVFDVAQLLHPNGISVILVTNGYVNLKPLTDLLPYISAMNIDLKAFSEDFYTNICGGKLQPVLKTISHASEKTHVEITLLLIETLNDDIEELRNLYSFIMNLSQDIPLHISKYFPRYKMSIRATNDAKLINTARIAKEYLNYVYIGNMHTSDFSNTYCPNCNALLIQRRDYNTHVVNLHGNQCSKCQKRISIIT